MLVSLSKSYPEETLFLWEIGYTFLDASVPDLAVPYFQHALEKDVTSFPAWGGLAKPTWKPVTGTKQSTRSSKGCEFARVLIIMFSCARTDSKGRVPEGYRML